MKRITIIAFAAASVLASCETRTSPEKKPVHPYDCRVVSDNLNKERSARLAFILEAEFEKVHVVREDCGLERKGAVTAVDTPDHSEVLLGCDRSSTEVTFRIFRNGYGATLHYYPKDSSLSLFWNEPSPNSVDSFGYEFARICGRYTDDLKEGGSYVPREEGLAFAKEIPLLLARVNRAQERAHIETTNTVPVLSDAEKGGYLLLKNDEGNVSAVICPDSGEYHVSFSCPKWRYVPFFRNNSSIDLPNNQTFEEFRADARLIVKEYLESLSKK